MESKSFMHHKIAKFQNVKVITKVWKAQIVLPFLMTKNEKDEKEKKTVWTINKVLN